MGLLWQPGSFKALRRAAQALFECVEGAKKCKLSTDGTAVSPEVKKWHLTSIWDGCLLDCTCCPALTWQWTHSVKDVKGLFCNTQRPQTLSCAVMQWRITHDLQ